MSRQGKKWDSLALRKKRATGMVEDARADDTNPLQKLFANEVERSARLEAFAEAELSRPVERDVEPLIDKAMANREWERRRAVREGRQSPATLREILDACED